MSYITSMMQVEFSINDRKLILLQYTKIILILKVCQSPHAFALVTLVADSVH